MPKHTPGPWNASPNAGYDIHGQSSVTSEASGATVAVTYQSDADARLIAAAPDLLAACEAIVTVLDGSQPVDVPGAVMVARAAIARATGE